MKKLYKTTLGYEKWHKKSGAAHKPWLEPEHSKLPLLDRNDIPACTSNEDDFEMVDEEDIDETNAEMQEKLSNGSDE